jgi:KAP-like P-loop domain-containing protein
MADPSIDLTGIWIAADLGLLRESGAGLPNFMAQGARGIILDLSRVTEYSEALDAFNAFFEHLPARYETAVRLPAADVPDFDVILGHATFQPVFFAEEPDSASDSAGGAPVLLALDGRKLDALPDVAELYTRIQAAGIYWTGDMFFDLPAKLERFGPDPTPILVEPFPEPGDDSAFLVVEDMQRRSANLPIQGVVLSARWPGLLDEMPQLARMFPPRVPRPNTKTAPDGPSLEKTVAPEPEDQGEDRGTASVAVSDSYTTKDTLGYSVYADALADFAAHPETLPPLAIGITAAWGSGKTSLMRQIEERFARLREQRQKSAGFNAQGAPPGADTEADIRVPFRTVWVDVWRYENSAALWASLAEEVYQQAAGQMGWWERQKFRMALDTDWGDDWPRDSVLRLPNVLRRRAKRAIGLGFVSVAVPALAIAATGFGDWFAGQLSDAAAIIGLPIAIAAGATGVTLTGLGALRDTLTREIKRFASPPENSEQVAYSKKSEDQIHRLVKILSRPEEGIRLAIFVDDLDRCSPDRVVDVVESINLLFSQSEGAGAVFFVGLDTDMVAASIDVAFEETVQELKARGNRAGYDFGYRFLQKILQMTFMIPPPLPRHVEGFLDSLLGVGDTASPGRTEDAVANNLMALDRGGASLQVQNVVDELRSQTNIESAQTVAQTAQAALPAEESAVVREEAAQVTLNLLRTDSADVQQAVRRGVRFLEPRPRDYKRFLNAFRLQVIISSRAEPQQSLQPATLAHIAKWTALQLRWPVILEEARSHDDLFGELEPLVNTYEAARSRLRELNDGASNGDKPADVDDLARASEAVTRAFEALPPRVRAAGDFGELIEVLASEPRLAGTDLHGIVLV